MENVQPKKLWSNYKVLQEVKKTDRTKLIVALGCNDGYRCVTIREWYFTKRTNEWKPGRDGVTIPLIHPSITVNADGTVTRVDTECLKGMLEALTQAYKELPEMALEDPEHELWYTPKPKVKKE